MKHPYLTIQSAGFTAYSDAMVGRFTEDGIFLHLLSLVGTPSAIKALAAILHNQTGCRIADNQGVKQFGEQECCFSGKVQTIRTRKIGGVVSKVLIQKNMHQKASGSVRTSFVYGENLEEVYRRAFLFLDAITTIPLKREWQRWLWEEVLQPQMLCSFGAKELQHAYQLYIPDDDTLQQRVLEGITGGYLQ